MRAIWTFNSTKDKHNSYRGEDCMKRFFDSLREHTVDVINFEKKKMLPLTEKELKHTKMQRNVTFAKKNSQKD